MAKKPVSRVPKKTRRLTRAEAAKLGISYSAKRRVNANVKRVTSRTKTYTDRQVFQATHGATKEAVTATKFEDLGKAGLQYKNLTRAQVGRVLKGRGHNKVQMMVFGKHSYSSARYTANSEGWVSTMIFADQVPTLIKRMNETESGELGFNKNNKPKRFSIILK